MTTLAEVYEKAGGNYQDALERLMNDKLIDRFLKKFPSDESYAQLKDFLAAGNLDEAFRAVHTLKGVAYNLSLTRLGDAASELTEVLRPGHEELRSDEKIAELMAAIDTEYATSLAAIQELD